MSIYVKDHADTQSKAVVWNEGTVDGGSPGALSEGYDAGERCDVPDDTAPMIPAAPGHYTLGTCVSPDGYVELVKVGVVAWRRLQGVAVPVTLYGLNQSNVDDDWRPPVLFPDGHIEFGDGSVCETTDEYVATLQASLETGDDVTE